MSKIVQAVNAMIENDEKIGNVIKDSSENEYYFLFDNKHKWSIGKPAEGFVTLYYYPGPQRIDELAHWPEDSWQHVQLVSYNTDELGTKEAQESFNELYTIVQEKAYGMDKVLDEIINTLPF